MCPEVNSLLGQGEAEPPLADKEGLSPQWLSLQSIHNRADYLHNNHEGRVIHYGVLNLYLGNLAARLKTLDMVSLGYRNLRGLSTKKSKIFSFKFSSVIS